MDSVQQAGDVADVVAGRYRLGREIARGGMGLVREARHLETGRAVAIKLVPREMRDAQMIEARLRREARVLGALQHPAIVEVLDAGTCPRSGFFIALEKLEGRSLDGLLAARRKLGVEESLWLAKVCGEALMHAHARGVVHRDMKPANIFVSVTPGGGEQVKLIDFGIAAFVASEGPTSAKLTAPGDLLGTLEYISPEQLSSPEVHDPRSDLYSLASVIYECLTGVLPSLSDRVSTPPRLLDLAAERSGVAPQVAAALRRAMQPRPEDRFERVADFLAALDAGTPVRACRLLQSSRGVGDSSEATAPTRVEVRRAPADVVGRRKHPRAPYITPCRVLFEDGHNIDGRSEDISVGGMLIVISAPRPNDAEPAGAGPGQRGENARVTLRFSLPTTGAIVTVAGTVRWLIDGRGRAALGVEFTSPPTTIQEAVSRYVDIIGQVEATG